MRGPGTNSSLSSNVSIPVCSNVNDLASRAVIDDSLDPDKAGDFQLRQDNYVRPYFPPLSSDWKPPAPFSEALYAIPVSSTTIDHADKCVASSSSSPLLDCVLKAEMVANESIKSSTGTPTESKTVKLNKQTSGIFQKRLPEKYDDPSMFTIPIRIGRFRIRKALLDLEIGRASCRERVYVLV